MASFYSRPVCPQLLLCPGLACYSIPLQPGETIALHQALPDRLVRLAWEGVLKRVDEKQCQYATLADKRLHTLLMMLDVSVQELHAGLSS